MMNSYSSSNSSRINIASSAPKLAVDNRISLRIYFRIADNLLRQAYIFRNEKNVIDLYVMLLRFSSLVSETIPRHQDYAASPKSKKSSLRKQLVNALDELESLNAAVKQKVKEPERKPAFQAIGWNGNTPSSVEWSPTKMHSLTDNQLAKVSWKFPGIQRNHEVMSEDDRFHILSLNVPRPKEETLSRHSILGPRGLCGNWQQPRSDKGVWYPTDIDTTPVEIPRLQQAVALEDELAVTKENNTLDVEIPSLELIHEGNDNNQKPQVCEQPMILFETSNVLDEVIIKQPTPPPALLEVQDLIPEKPTVVEKQNVADSSLPDGLLCPESPMELHISTSMMDTFMKLAKSNTVRNLETCGVLAGSLKNRKFYVTALIIPKQVSTSDSCQTTNEEEIFEVQDKQSLFPLGWIHTHPTQSCFMSSIDVHTHYSYQVMLPEAVAIVMAPRDSSKKHGIFRLTTPGGMSLIRNCQRRGFHAHDPPADGGPIYSNCTDVYMNPKLKFDVIDLR